MYVYQVTNTTTKDFYIGFEETVLHQSGNVLDPMSVFTENFLVHNGDTTMNVLDKRVLQRVGDKNEAKELLSSMAKHHQNNPNFLGVKMTIKPPKEVASTKVITKEKE